MPAEIGGERFEARSAGLESKGLDLFTVKVMEEAGMNISGQTSKGVETYLGKVLFQYLIICDDTDKNCPTVWPGVNTRMHWSFEDPAKVEGDAEQKLAEFREIRDLIEGQGMPGRTIVMFVMVF